MQDTPATALALEKAAWAIERPAVMARLKTALGFFAISVGGAFPLVLFTTPDSAVGMMGVWLIGLGGGLYLGRREW